ncbi:uncharacterized protein LOC120841481 [Ixodes scapularis]|uniref:uncharacterized protein LOC120841481 n=1 Tax=Ixodes scapularis TaxID=6945 RepID=UPI001A9DB279|nr:uncharacterized protein LOC120841481 [Ixodes scapularis]
MVHFIQVRNVVYESACFNRREQGPTETVDQYITVLYNMADRCDYGSLRDRLIRDRFVLVLRDKSLSETLQLDAALTLTSAHSKARQKESVHKQQQLLRETEVQPPVKTEDADFDAVAKGSSSKPRSALSSSNATRTLKAKQPSSTCGYCGGLRHARSECPARAEKCARCKTKGHYARVCKKMPGGTKGISSVEQNSTPTVFLGAVGEFGKRPDAKFTTITLRQQNAEPLMPTVTPSLPRQKVGLDWFQLRGKEYLLRVD